MACGTGGGQDASGFHVFDRLKATSHRPAARAWVDGTYLQKVGVPQQGLRRVFQAIGGEAYFSEYVTLDVAGHGLRISMPTCEACGATIATGRGKRIESGQLLCDGCLPYFRRA